MNQTIGVNITPQSIQPTLHFSQGDVGRVFVVNVTDYDIPSGATVTCVATKPSGMGFTVSGTVSGNSVTFTSTAEMTDEWGRFPAEIRIASGNTLLGTANFLMVGEKDPHPASTIDGTQEELIPQLTLLVNRVEAAAESVHDLTVSATTLAAGSDATATYDSTNNSIAFGIPRGADGDVTRSEFNDLKSDLVTYAPDNNNVVLGDVAKTDTTGRAWYQADGLVQDTPNADNIKSVVALSYVEDGVQINYSSFTGGDARTQLMLATSGAIGATVVKYWPTISASIDIGNLDGNILTISKAKITELYPTATHIFINIDKTSGSIKGVAYLADETTVESIGRIDSNIDAIEADMDDSLTVGTKVVSKAVDVIDGAYLFYSSGAVTTLSDASYTKFAVEPSEVYFVTTKLTGNVGIAFYNSSGTFISGLSYSDFGNEILTDAKVVIPLNCATLGISTRNEATNPISVKKVVHRFGELQLKADVVKESASGEIVTFYDGADGAYFDKFNITIDSDSGITDATIIRAGKNLLPKFQSNTDANITFTANSDGSVSISGTSNRNYAATTYDLPTGIVKLLQGRKVVLSGGGNSSIYMQLKIVSGGSTIYRTTASRGNLTIDMPASIDSIEAKIQVPTSGTIIPANTVFYPQIELGALPTKYEPCVYDEILLDWSDTAGSVTDGVVDVINGIVTKGATEYQTLVFEVTSLLGANTIWSDAGIVDVTYRADTKLYTSIDRLTKEPPYIVNNLCYKPLGVLSKPYICLSTDDGEEELATYTIPMVTGKGVPMTFCIWTESEVMLDPTYTALVVDAVNNHGCEVAQHGRDA